MYPFRAIYSDAATDSADVRVNNWLVYRALSFHDFPQNYGNLTSLDGIQNKAILARFENKSLLYNNLLTIDTSNPQAAYIGNPNLFDSSPPIDFAETDLGYVGAQNKFLLKIPQGQITVDAKRGQVFLVNGGQVADLTGYGSGVNRFMTDHLPFKILEYFPNADTDNHFNGIGIHGVYDSKFERIIITKLDYTPLSDDIKYNEDTGDFYVELGTGASSFRTEIPTPIDSVCNEFTSVPFTGTINVEYIPCGTSVETESINFDCGLPEGEFCTGIELCARSIVKSNWRMLLSGKCFSGTTTTTTTDKDEITTTSTTTEDSFTDETTSTTTTFRQTPAPIRVISLNDETYFCNKSWTMSFDFNSQSWISFHSYLPNFYIGENNFYYSGINGCCSTNAKPNLEVIAGPIKKATINTTTTTTTGDPLFTTTTTSTTLKDCEMDNGFFIPTKCDLIGTGIITVPPTTTTTKCARPSTVVEEVIFEGYQIVGQSPVISSGNAKDACDAAGFVTLTSNIQATTSTLPITFTIQVNYRLEVGQQAFLGDDGDCTPAPDGWYWTNETYGSNNSVFQIYNGIISDMYDCSCVQTTTTTTTAVPFIEECDTILFDMGTNKIGAINRNAQSLINLTIPGYTSPSDIALTSTKFWSVSSDIKEWDIDQLDPFVATGNELATGPKRTITLPIGFGTVDSIVAIDDTTLIAIDDSSPANGIELDITTLAATGTTKFTLQNNREAISNMLYTTNGRVLVVNKDTLSSINYISEYEYSTGVLNTEVNIGSVEGKVLSEYEGNIVLFTTLLETYILSPVAPYTLIDGGTNLSETITSGSSIMSCVCKSLSANTTTTSTTGAPTTTTTTTISATCNEYEVTGPTAIYYTNCFGQQESISVGSGQTLRVCASVAIPGATLIGPCL